ncbi:MAG: V-type ATP synthase subunit E [Phycisphaerae bacterium]|nr:V-type ATP synthase subunit E [Phycisphaerae bacterium]
MAQDDNYDKLLHAVNEQATLDRGKVMAEAAEQVRRIEAQTHAEIEQLQGQIRARADREIDQEKDRLSGQSHMAFRAARQAARVRLLKQVFAEAEKAVAALPQSPQYRDILGALITEALAAAGPDALVKVAVSDEKVCRAWLSQHRLSCTVEGIKAERGTVLAVSADGDRQVDNSLSTRLARAESLCQQDAAAFLFQETSDNRGPV